jgi:hypothetical protein
MGKRWAMIVLLQFRAGSLESAFRLVRQISEASQSLNSKQQEYQPTYWREPFAPDLWSPAKEDKQVF